MKKIILSITSIIIGAALAITLILVFYDKKREVYVKSTYNDVRLSLGKTKVKEVNKSQSSPIEVKRIYTMKDPYEFYEEHIKTSEYYNSKLVFEDKYEYIYGYLVKDEVAFKFRITDEDVTLSTMGDDAHIDSDYSLILGDFIDFIGGHASTPIYDEDCRWNFYYRSDMVKYEDVVELYTHMNKDMVKIDGDVIYLKGYDRYELTMSDDYVVKIVNRNGYPYGYVYDYVIN